MKLPRTEAIPLKAAALTSLRFWLGVSIFLFLFMAAIYGLALKNNESFHWIIPVLSLLIFVGWPAWISLSDYRKYIKALQLEHDHIICMGTVLDLVFEDDSYSGIDISIESEKYWAIFSVYEGEPVKQSVSIQTFKSLKPGNKIRVKVSPVNRRILRAEVD